MSAAQSPLPMVYRGSGLFQVPRGHIRRADAQFGAGEYIVMAPQEERSTAAHRAYFAAVNECWKSLPEDMAGELPTADRMRKRALIMTGWRDETSHVCATHAEAVRTADVLRRYADPDAMISVSGSVVVVLEAKSQAYRAMNKEDFRASSEAVLRFLAEKLGIAPDHLPTNEAA